MKNKSSFLKNLLVLLGLGVLLAPDVNEDNLYSLNKSFTKLMKSIKDIDFDNSKKKILKIISKLEDLLEDLGNIKGKKLIKEYIDNIHKLASEVVELCDTDELLKVKEYTLDIEKKSVNYLEKLLKKN